MSLKLKGVNEGNKILLTDYNYSEESGGAVLATAEFKTKDGTSEDYKLDGDSIRLRYENEVERTAAESKAKAYGVKVSLGASKKSIVLELDSPEDVTKGKYSVSVKVDGLSSWATYDFEIAPDFYSSAVYVNKCEGDVHIYVDGKKDLMLSLETRGWNGERGVDYELVEGATYSLYKNGSDQVKSDINGIHIEGDKLVVPATFTGTEKVYVLATAENRYGANTISDYYNYNIVEVTSEKIKPDRLRLGHYLNGYFESDEESVEPGTPSVFLPSQIDGLYMQASYRDSWDLVDIPSKYVVVDGESLTLVENNGNTCLKYTGTPGMVTIKAVSDWDGAEELFKIKVESVDRTMAKLIDRDNNEFPVTEAYQNDKPYFYAAVGTKYYTPWNQRTGKYKVVVKGGVFAENEGIIYPSAYNTTVMLKVGNKTLKTYKITNSIYKKQLPTVKGVSYKLYPNYADNSHAYVTPKNIPEGTYNIEVYEDNSYFKIKDAKALSTYRGIMSSMFYSKSQKAIGYYTPTDYKPGKYTFRACYKDSSDNVIAKPFKIVVTVLKKNPVGSIKLKSSTIKVKSDKCESSRIIVKTKKNVQEYLDVRLVNSTAGGTENEFTSYFKFSAEDPLKELDENGYVSVIAVDNTATAEDLKGALRIGFTSTNGTWSCVDVPIKVKWKK